VRAWFIKSFILAGAASFTTPSLADDGPLSQDLTACRAKTAPDAVALEAFGAIKAAFRGRLPGPAGGAALERSVGRIASAYLDYEGFARRALGPAGEAVGVDEYGAWTTRLASVIERRYLSRMGSPVGGQLAIRSVTFACPDATLVLAVTHRDSRKNKEFTVVVRLGESGWRAIDAIVDEVSLVTLYRGRFGRAFLEGGVEGARDYLDALYERYGSESAKDGGATPF